MKSNLQISSRQIIYSEHEYDECFEYIDGSGRVPDGQAIGYISKTQDIERLVLFTDVDYSKYEHKYWDNLELENDVERLFLP
tara:strand:+ start:538 stop:783 length:246 start_codon:yes stop_codon:yes gene_type:complete